jgi:DNA (cytosine-5)-methyltransferase 1
MTQNANYVSLFSGAGGLDLGLERAGLRPISLCEIEPQFCRSLRANRDRLCQKTRTYFSDSVIFEQDIKTLSGHELTRGYEIDIVVGGPPCQSFSSSGNQKSILDPRGSLVMEFVRIINEIRPKIFLFENVRGLITARDATGEPGGVVRDLFRQFWQAGYSCRAALLNSADYGSYQRRVRCFIIGTRHGLPPHFPEPTHQKQANLFHPAWRSLQEFLEQYADCDRSQYVFPTESLAQELSVLPNGTGLKSRGKSEKTRPGGHWGYRQGTFIADLSLPARTVTGSSSQDWVRWNGDLRRLTLREVMLLQGFPEDWEVCGTKTQKFKQVGNAVPVVFGELLGCIILDFLRNYPVSPPQFIGLPQSFEGYITYTKKDHAKNLSARTVHKQFEKS